MMINLSIIIPHYNSAHTLKILLNSIGQHDDVETIIIDDLSTQNIDEFDEIKEQFSSANYLFYQNDSGIKGAGAARNIGLSHARGQWILFADSDDYMLPGWYDIVHSYFDNDADIVFFPPTCIDVTSGKSGRRADHYIQLCQNYWACEEKAEYRLRFFWGGPCSKMIRRQIVADHNITFSNSIVTEDEKFSVEAGYYASRITAASQSIYCITESTHSMTSCFSENKFYISTDEYCKKYKFMQSVGVAPSILLPIHTFQELKRRHLLFKLYGKYRRLFRKYQIPVITKAFFNFKRIRHWIKQH